MKNQFLVLLVLFIGFLSCGEKESQDKGPWKLVWEENFDGKILDETIWSKIPRAKSDGNNFRSDYEGLYVFQDGKLVLRGFQNTVSPNDTAPFISGGVYTKDKKTFGLGRLEIKAKLNSAQGTWSTFWMLPKAAEWPTGGQIDIMERFNHDKFIYQSIYSNYATNLEIKDTPPASSVVAINPNDYHVYAIEKYQDSLVFYVDDTKTKIYPRIETDLEGQFPFADQEFYLLLGVQLGSSWVGEINPAELPVDMFIDWVRFYEMKPSE